MKVYYFIRNFGVGGGCKVMLQHVKMLRNAGIDSKLFVLKSFEMKDLIDFNLVHLNPEGLTEANILVATLPKDIKNLYKIYNKKGPILCHLCQGYEPIDLMARITKESIPEKYIKKSGLQGNIAYALTKNKFKRRIRKIEKIYALDTKKIAVSRHLKELIEKKYHQKSYYVPNGIDRVIFFPKDATLDYTSQKKIKILSVGSMDVAFKGIPDTLKAIRILKDRLGITIEFIRVSPIPLTLREMQSGLIDQYYIGISEKQMADLFRDAHIFVSSSLEGEGFGLPAIEAMSCGTPSVLTEISSYQNFDKIKDFAFFVPTHDPIRITEGIRKIIENKVFREHLIHRGFEIAEKFSLENTARSLLEAINEIILHEREKNAGRAKEVCC